MVNGSYNASLISAGILLVKVTPIIAGNNVFFRVAVKLLVINFEKMLCLHFRHRGRIMTYLNLRDILSREHVVYKDTNGFQIFYMTFP